MFARPPNRAWHPIAASLARAQEHPATVRYTALTQTGSRNSGGEIKEFGANAVKRPAKAHGRRHWLVLSKPVGLSSLAETARRISARGDGKVCGQVGTEPNHDSLTRLRRVSDSSRFVALLAPRPGQRGSRWRQPLPPLPSRYTATRAKAAFLPRSWLGRPKPWPLRHIAGTDPTLTLPPSVTPPVSQRVRPITDAVCIE